MCLVLFAKDVWEGFPILILANRDEFFDRKSQVLHFWNESPKLLAGKDLVSNGTWLGVSESGKISFITNRRNLREANPVEPLSRGALVKNYLVSDLNPSEYVEQIQNEMDRYPGFNLFVSDLKDSIYVSNRVENSAIISSGIHTLSNAEWNTPWPKTERIKNQFQNVIEKETSRELPIDAFFKILADEQKAVGEILPDTGIGKEKEFLLSSIRIALPGYGTRVSSIVAIDENAVCHFWEKTFAGPTSQDGKVVKYSFLFKK